MALRDRIRASAWMFGNLVRRLTGRQEVPLQWGRSKIMPLRRIRITVDPKTLGRRSQ